MADEHDDEDEAFIDPLFRCERDGFEALSGNEHLGHDGRDRRAPHAPPAGRRWLMVSMHERLHHELQWSTAWGVLAAMTGLLAGAGVDGQRFGPVATAANAAARDVHEQFATTVGVGVVGVPDGRSMLAGHPAYLGHLDAGLRLGGPPDRWPWQFRESAIQMLLRTLMQPLELLDVAERGLAAVRAHDVADPAVQPDARLRVVAGEAGRWWDSVFAQLYCEHPTRGGDQGGTWSREIPSDPDEVEELKAWEETVLIPALQDVARTELRRRGLPVLDARSYLEAVGALRRGFVELGPDDWRVEVLSGRRPGARPGTDPTARGRAGAGPSSVSLAAAVTTTETSLPLAAPEARPEGVREAVRLRPEPMYASVIEPADFPTVARAFLREAPRPHVLALHARAEVLRRQFAGLGWLPSGTPLLALVGETEAAMIPPAMQLALLQQDLDLASLTELLGALPVVVLTTTSTLGDGTPAPPLDETLVLVDTPLVPLVDTWLARTLEVRFRVLGWEGGLDLDLAVFHHAALPGCWFLRLHDQAGFSDLVHVLDHNPERLRHGLEIPDHVRDGITSAVAWILGTWTSIDEHAEP